LLLLCAISEKAAAYDFPPACTYSLPIDLDAGEVGDESIYAILKFVRYPNGGSSSWPNEISVARPVIDEIFVQTQPITGAFFTFDQTVNVVAFSTGKLIGTGSFDVQAAPVPEPATLALFGAGLLALGGLARSRRRSV
jgi:hypothetical protein